MKSLSVLFCILCFVNFSYCNNLGRCPSVAPIPDLNLESMLGKWYVIQETNCSLDCLINTIEKDGDDKYLLKQISHNDTTSWSLTKKEGGAPGKMMIHYTFSSARFTFFVGNSNSYVGIYVCNNMGILHKASGKILSRTPYLEDNIIEKLHGQFSQLDINWMNVIRHDFTCLKLA